MGSIRIFAELEGIFRRDRLAQLASKQAQNLGALAERV